MVATNVITPDTAKQHAGRAGRGDLNALQTLLRALSRGEPYQTYAGDPTGNVTPEAIGQTCFDSTNSAWYKATGLTSSDWTVLGDSGKFDADLYRTSAAVTKNASVTYGNVTGLSATVVPGTYKFRAVLPSTVASGTGGIKYCFNYTTAVLSALEATAKGYTASAVAVQHTTTTTTQTDLFTQAAVVILTEIEGTMVVTTGGTVDVQMAQNTSNASDTVALVGGSLELHRIS